MQSNCAAQAGTRTPTSTGVNWVMNWVVTGREIRFKVPIENSRSGIPT
jgi:hypothetical protein